MLSILARSDRAIVNVSNLYAQGHVLKSSHSLKVKAPNHARHVTGTSVTHPTTRAYRP